MEDKRLNGYPVYTDDDDGITNVASSGELTGLQPRLPTDNTEVESYASLYGTPKTMEALVRGTNLIQPNKKKNTLPKRTLPM